MFQVMCVPVKETDEAGGQRGWGWEGCLQARLRLRPG